MKSPIRYLAAASAMALFVATGLGQAPAAKADGHELKVGIILGFTGPIESLTPGMAAAAELAMKEVSDSGLLLGGKVLVPVRADSTCIDAAAATAAAERLITSDSVVAIMGADCSGVTTAIANNTAVPNGVVMISPSATSPALSTIDDNGYFFRTSPSDARQGQVLADVLKQRGIMDVAITYTNNDYGKGLADSFTSAFLANGGKIEMTAAQMLAFAVAADIGFRLHQDAEVTGLDFILDPAEMAFAPPLITNRQHDAFIPAHLCDRLGFRNRIGNRLV